MGLVLWMCHWCCYITSLSSHVVSVYAFLSRPCFRLIPEGEKKEKEKKKKFPAIIYDHTILQESTVSFRSQFACTFDA